VGRYIVAITGASGAVYGRRLTEVLADQGHFLYLLITDPAKQVIAAELGWDLSANEADQQAALAAYLGPERAKHITYLDYHDLTAAVASGSVKTEGLVVLLAVWLRWPASPTGWPAIWLNGQPTSC
jgi:4-hydroxy-3-polyprenylbenzoate decarboxylase